MHSLQKQKLLAGHVIALPQSSLSLFSGFTKPPPPDTCLRETLCELRLPTGTHTTMIMLFFSFALLQIPSVATAHTHKKHTHKCVHHQLEIPVPNAKTRSVQEYSSPVENDNNTPISSISRRLTTTKSNMRIHVEFDAALKASSTALSIELKKQVLQAALYWESALKVTPLSSALSFDLTCQQGWDATNDRAYQCAEYVAKETCGDVDIPSTWLKKGNVCTGCYETSCSGCSDIPAGGVGLANTDFAILVSAKQTNVCDGETLGFASPCQFDQNDRPILGSMNFCPTDLAAAAADLVFSTTLHELAHALGFTSSSMPFFRDPTTSTLVPRTARDQYDAPPQTTKLCADGQSYKVKTPASTTVSGPQTLRGFPHSFVLTTPNVAKAAKEHFSCPSLTGVELENQMTGAASSCWGSHWENRVLHTELMTAVVNSKSVVSEFTLAYFEDTGWYEADFTKAGHLHWGNLKGCDFVTKKCNTGTKDAPSMQLQAEGYFCSEVYAAPYTTTMTGCTHGGLSKGYCNQKSYTTTIPVDAFSYFTDPKQGGLLSTMDFCPMYDHFSNGICSDTSNQKTDQLNYYGDIYGSSSKCIRTTTKHEKWENDKTPNSACAEIVCNNEGTSAVVTLKDINGVKQSITCAASDAGTGKVMSNFHASGYVYCPDLAVHCPPKKKTFVSWYKNRTIVITPPWKKNNRGASPSSTSAELGNSSSRSTIRHVWVTAIFCFVTCVGLFN